MGGVDSALFYLGYRQSPAFQKIMRVFCDTKHSDAGFVLTLLFSLLLSTTKKTTKKRIEPVFSAGHGIIFSCFPV